MDFVQLPQVGEILEQGKQNVATTTTNTVKSGVSDTISSVKSQIGGINNNANQNQMSNIGEPGMELQNQGTGNEATEQMVKDFYAPSNPTATPKSQTQEQFETEQKLVKLRQELHTQTYFDPLFAYEHKKQERPLDIAKQEEEQQKMIELEQKKQDKKLPLAVQRAQTSVEINRGASG